MTPEELREKRAQVIRKSHSDLWDWENCLDPILNALESLDAEYTADAQSAQDAYYSFLTALDWDYKALKAGQGNTPRLLTAIDHTMSTLSAYAEYLKGVKS